MAPSPPRQNTLPGFEPADLEPPAAARGSAAAASPLAPESVPDSNMAAPPDSAAGPDAPANDPRGKTVYVVDANSLIFQVFHGMPEMTGPRGEPVAAVHGFVRDILFLLESRRPDYLFIAFDRPEPTFRHAIYDAYKATRREMPEDLKPQFPAIRRVLDAFGAAVLDMPGYEADDILASVAHQAEMLGAHCFLVTADKDCRQLLSDQVRMFNIRKNEVFDASSLAADWGVAPRQVVDFQSLVGDSVDNVPGVPGIGPKTAQELLAKFGTLDAILAGAESLPKSKRRDNLIQFREQALMSRRLVALDRSTPVAIDWAAGQMRHADPEQVAALFAEFGFRNLGQRLKTLYDRGAAEPGAAGAMPANLNRPVARRLPRAASGSEAAPTAPSGRFRRRPRLTTELSTPRKSSKRS